MVTISVDGMSCQHCVNSVEKALQNLEGIKSIQVNLDSKLVTLEGEVSSELACKAIEAEGYNAKPI